MTRFFDIDAANEALIEVAPLLATLSDQRAELIRLRDRALAAHSAAAGGGSAADDREENQRIRLRMQGIIDQMAAAVARIERNASRLAQMTKAAMPRSTPSSGTPSGKGGP